MKKSAGLLLFRIRDDKPEFFLVHPGGPFWKNKDDGAWSVPKGEFSDNEEPQVAAKREFQEETGVQVSGKFIELVPVKQRSGKMIYCWGLQYDLDPSIIKSNLFQLEWPPKSGRYLDVPEVDRADWFNYETAKKKLIPGQVALLDELYTLTKQLIKSNRV